MTEPKVELRRLVPDDADALMAFRRAALLDAPLAFGSSPEDDRAAARDFVLDMLARDDQAVFGAFDGELVGMVGVYRERQRKSTHKCGIWGLYVAPPARSHGIARALVRAAVDFAASLTGVSHVRVSATDDAPQALSLYRSLGFVEWGVEPAALRAGGREVAEHHLILWLS